MTREDHLMTIGMEECAELAQRISKAQRFGMEQIQEDADDKPEENPEHLTNRQRIIEEYTHLVAAMEMMGIPLKEVNGKKMDAKIAKVERYLIRSKESGRL